MENQIVEPVPGIYQCVDCGAHASKPERIKHYRSCKPGESERWAKYYADEETTVSSEQKEEVLHEPNWSAEDLARWQEQEAQGGIEFEPEDTPQAQQAEE